MNWVTNAELVAAVSNAGGMGILGTNAGQSEVVNDPRAVADRMRQEIRKTKELTSNSFGINILTPPEGMNLDSSKFTKAILKSAFEEKIHYFAVVGTAHKETFDVIKQYGGVIIFRPLTPSIEQAQLAEQLGADVIVATGHDEGGILPNDERGTFTVVGDILDAVSIPVFAAGGINDKRTADAAFSLGASGIYVGTRFLVATESPVAKNIKDLIVESASEDTVMVSGNQRAISTNRAKYFSNSFVKSHDTSAVNQMISKDGGLRKSMLMGNANEGVITVNNGISSIKGKSAVSEIIEELLK